MWPQDMCRVHFCKEAIYDLMHEGRLDVMRRPGSPLDPHIAEHGCHVQREPELWCPTLWYPPWLHIGFALEQREIAFPNGHRVGTAALFSTPRPWLNCSRGSTKSLKHELNSNLLAETIVDAEPMAWSSNAAIDDHNGGAESIQNVFREGTWDYVH